MTMLRHNFENVSPQTQVTMGDLSERILRAKGQVNGVLEKMKRQKEIIEERRKSIESIAVMCEESRDPDIILFAKYLRETGDVNIKHCELWTLLMKVSYFGYIEIIEPILAHPDIIVNEKNRRGETALILAAISQKTPVIELLLAHPDILVNEKDNDGFTALMYASNRRITELLLAHPDILVNEKNDSGFTALMIVAKTLESHNIIPILNHPHIDLKEHNQGKEALKVAKNEKTRSLIEAKMREQEIEF